MGLITFITTPHACDIYNVLLFAKLIFALQIIIAIDKSSSKAENGFGFQYCCRLSVLIFFVVVISKKTFEHRSDLPTEQEAQMSTF